jgi:hypothetical protein
MNRGGTSALQTFGIGTVSSGILNTKTVVLISVAYLCLSIVQYRYAIRRNCPCQTDDVNSTVVPGKGFINADSQDVDVSISNSAPTSCLRYSDRADSLLQADAKVLCLKSPYGQTFNRIIAVANTLASAAEDYPHFGTMRVGLDFNYSIWYDSFAERLSPTPLTANVSSGQRPGLFEPLLHHFAGECTFTVTGEAMYWKLGLQSARNNRLQTILPKLKFRREAERILQDLRQQHGKRTIVTVHRRDLDGQRQSFARNKAYSMCHDTVSGDGTMLPPTYGQVATVDQLVDIDYGMVVSDLDDLYNNDTLILLLTDRQVPELDATFPLIGNYTFAVESWLMTLSDIHFGNPFSTVDYVVYTWRRDYARKGLNTMRPQACYP